MASPRCHVAVALALTLAVGVTAGCAGERDRRPAVPGPTATATATAGPTGAPSPTPVPETTDESQRRAATLVASLTDEELVGQVLMPYAYGSSATKVDPASAAGNRELAGVDTPAQMVARYRLGAVILVGFAAGDPTGTNQPTTNVENPGQVRDLTGGLREAAGGLAAGGVPLLIGTDQEFGTVTRIRSGVTALPGAMAIGAAHDPRRTEIGWGAAGAELAALGINVDFAPVADVVTAGGGVIGSRSYGADPRAVAAQVAASVRGLQKAGVAATLKHFPGHGGTSVDSHTELPVLAQNRQRLDDVDLRPFAAGIDAGAWLVMSGHLDARAIDPGVSATFSHKVLTDVLRGDLGFQGVVVSDAMNMAPAMKWPAGEAAVRALKAGNDLLLMPPNLAEAYEGVLSALRTGELPRERLVDAATRVLTLRHRLAGRAAPAMSTLNTAAHRQAAAALAAGAVTQFTGRCGAVVRGPVTVTASSGRETARSTLERALKAAGVRTAARGGTVVHLVGYGDGTSDLRPGAAVTVAMDTPYLLGRAGSGRLYATYSSSPASLTALARVLAGRARPTGRSPVPVTGLPATVC